MLKNVDLNKLRSFYWVHRRRRLLVAARDLNVTSSAVSQSIRGLERELGTTLFTRAGKQYLATREGDLLFTTVAPFLAQLGELGEKFGGHFSHSTASGRIFCGAPFEYGSTKLVEHVGKFQAACPGVQIAVTLLDTQRLYESVLDNRLDFAICDELPRRAISPLLDLKPLCEETLLLCASQAYWKEHIKGDVSLRHLKTLTYIPYVERNEAVHKWFEHHFGRYPDLRWRFMIDSVRGVYAAVVAGMGLGVLPESRVAADVTAGSVKIVATRKPALVNRMVVAQLKDRVTTPVQRRFVEHLTALEGCSVAKRSPVTLVTRGKKRGALI